MKTLKLEVYGRVQGVFFRANTKEFCDKLKLKGYVKNQDDGSVLITAQGANKNLSSLINWIKNNPGASKVKNIKQTIMKTKQAYHDFQIIRENPFFNDKKKALKNLKNSLIYVR